MLIKIRHFHATVSLSQRPDHPLYKNIDWSNVGAGNYAVVDPFDTHAILYLSEKAYQVQVRVSLSQDSTLVVLARPGDKPATTSSNADPSQNSPIPSNSPKEKVFTDHSVSDLFRKNSTVWKKFLNWHMSHLARRLNEVKISKGPTFGKPEIGAPSSTKKGPTVTESAVRKGSMNSKTSVSLSIEVIRLLIPYWGLDLHFRLGGEIQPPRALIQSFRELACDLTRTLEAAGPQHLILFLKNTLFFLKKFHAGTPSRNPWLLQNVPVALSRSGIPRVIPLLLRRRLSAGRKTGRHDLVACRLINSLLNSFRAMEGTHEMQDLASIRGPHPTLDPQYEAEFAEFCKVEFWKVMMSNVPKHKRERLMDPEQCFRITENKPVYVPTRAGPNSSFALFGAPFDALAWLEQPKNYPIEWCRLIGDTRTPEVFSECVSRTEHWRYEYCVDNGDMPIQLRVGKVQCLPEPAGKVRTIAIVDYWTQRLMSPVHEWMLEILSHQPTDGTFDQEGAVQSFARLFEISPEKAYSIDLKSATDMIPISLYRAVFNGLWRPETVSLWIDFLTDRWFWVPVREKLVVPELRGCSIRYGRGQPMGTLSSWPAMALVHHALELFAAKKAGKNPADFVEYRVLGDDNVTLGSDVADSYVACATGLCVPTSFHKTLDGELFVFAEQIYLRGENISPLSLREELGIGTYSQRLELALRMIRRGWLDDRMTIPRLLRLLLTKADYVSAMRQWSVGRLGKIVQSALVSAFGISSKTLIELMGFRGSGIKPFLNALKGRIEALAGDGAELDKATHTRACRDLERALAVRVGAALYERLTELLDDVRVSSIRFTMWKDAVTESGFMPYATWVPPKPKGAPALPGILAVPSRTLPTSTLVQRMKDGEVPGIPGLTESKYPPEFKPFLNRAQSLRYDTDGTFFLFSDVNREVHSALWPVIEDSYKSLFGTVVAQSDRITSPDVAFDYGDIVAEDEEYGGMGMTFTPEPEVTPSPAGWSVTTPGIVAKVSEVREKAKAYLDTLVREDSLPAPWLVLNELAEVVAKIERLPDFTSVTQLREKLEVRSDVLKDWIRVADILTNVLTLLPVGAGFTVPTEADMPLGPQGNPEDSEILNPIRVDLSDVTAVLQQNKQGLLTG